MTDVADPVLEAVAALWVAGIAVAAIGEELERWLIGDLTFSDSGVLRLADCCGLIPWQVTP